MICWVATWPGCGSTLHNQILHSVFGRLTYLQHSDQGNQRQRIPESEIKRLGGAYYSGSWTDFRSRAANSSDTHFVKTHLPPADDQPAIVVVRDGRAACASYWHYQNFYFPDPSLTLLDVILGNIAFGDWTSFYAGWNPLTRANTLILKFEDLKIRPSAVLPRMARFLGLDPVGNWHDDFAENARHVPGVFRRGSLDSWREDFSADLQRVFWACHGDWMEKLGYPPNEDDQRICVSPMENFAELMQPTLRAISKLIQQRDEYLGICEARQTVITELAEAAEARLRIIQQLSGLAK